MLKIDNITKVEMFVRCTVYDLIHYVIFVLIELFVMLYEYLSNQKMNEQSACLFILSILA
jgi:hypothetical protein